MTYLPPLPVAVPFAVAALLTALAPLLPRRVLDVTAVGTALAVSVLCGLLLAGSLGVPLVYWFGGWTPRDGVALGIAFVIDPIGAALALLVALLTTASLIYSWRYFDEIGALFVVLMLVFLGAMVGFCLTGDLFNLFVFFELMGVAAYALTGYKIEEPQALMGAFSFAITNSIGAFMVLVALGLLYGRTGALNMAQIGQALGAGRPDGLIIVALVLITCGFGVKAALAPFHFWLADAHAVAPTPVCVLFSGVMVELGLYAIVRIYWTVFAGVLAPYAAAVGHVWMALAILTAIVGGVMCFAERHLKRLLALSTISHTGVFFAGAALLTAQGLAGSAVYIVGHGLVKGGLFFAAGILLNRFGSVDEGMLQGKGRRFPLLGLFFVVAGLALSGMPPFGTYLGKSLIDESSRRAGYGWLPYVLLLSSALTGGAVLRAAGRIFLGWGPPLPEEENTPKREKKETKEDYDHPPLVMFLPAVVLLALAILPGCWPHFDNGAQQAAVRFEATSDYAQAVLYNVDTIPHAPGPSDPEGSALLSGFEAAAGAVVCALVALFSRWIPGWIARLAQAVTKPPLAVVRALHSGDVGDYVTWMVVGTALVGALYTVLMGVG